MAGYYFFSKYRNRHLCGVANMGMTEQQIIESLATKVMRWIEEDGYEKLVHVLRWYASDGREIGLSDWELARNTLKELGLWRS